MKGIAHITGGGLFGNIPRVLPEGKKIVLYQENWKIPAIFNLIKEKGRISKKEMLATFNLGIGMAIIVPPEESKKVMNALARMKILSCLIGEVK